MLQYDKLIILQHMLCRFVSSSYVYKWHVAYPMDILDFLVSYKYSLQFSDPKSPADTIDHHHFVHYR